MNLFVAVTDDRWFEYHTDRQPDEVNFWRPRSRMGFRALSPGEPMLFKLHSPNDYIVGGGFFVRHSVLPISLAWKAFGDKNGTGEYGEFRQRVVSLGQRTEVDPFIGCTILGEPFFFPRDMWIPVPAEWKKNIVVGKTYDTADAIGDQLWQDVTTRLDALQLQPSARGIVAEAGERYGTPYLTRGRLGQGAFRVLVTDAYTRRCAITGEKTLPVLEACHIQPYSEGGPNRIDNGLLLRSDLHTLFDAGYMTITPDRHIEISSKIREEFENGRDYYAHHGHQLQVVPATEFDQPAKEYLEWHNQYRFAS